ncbi:preprotein translocase subunit SecG [Sphingomicrobium aestuariivivum]|uniref:preprotein translocase subunit SecG n=1 Tax=Sphingomicrobium aestuariivivum TaxID=1582356 RepID=UPI001FD67EFB|nr:preprotein translocase subunit SecG [Sphingomicrobium aestuariivivum]MCJ8190071.1 preprotein translocase subunit SecG [Sphingomicrobium aestuariivivum]
MFQFLLVVQALIALALVSAILMQRSEGGGLGVGGSSAGLMTARGKADFLSRSTAILATLFIGMSIVLAALAATRDEERGLDTSLVGETAPVAADEAPAAPAEPAPAENGVPLAQ